MRDRYIVFRRDFQSLDKAESCWRLSCSQQGLTMTSKSFYQNQAQAYFDQTFGVDPSSFLLPLDMDALLLIGALVHVPYKRFQLIFSRILRAMKPQGHVLLTMKQGQGTQTRPDGRVFYLWSKADLMPIFEDCSLICVEYFEQQSKIRASDTWMSFVLQSQLSLS